MKQDWLVFELEAHWQMTGDELSLLEKREHDNHFGFCVMLKFFQFTGYFPSNITDIPVQVVE